MPFFVGQKVQISSKNSLKSRSSPISTNFVKNQYFRHDAQFSSFRQFFVKNEIIWSIIMVIVVTKYRIIRGYTTSYAKSPSYYLSVFCLCRNINSIKNSVIWWNHTATCASNCFNLWADSNILDVLFAHVVYLVMLTLSLHNIACYLYTMCRYIWGKNLLIGLRRNEQMNAVDRVTDAYSTSSSAAAAAAVAALSRRTGSVSVCPTSAPVTGLFSRHIDIWYRSVLTPSSD